MDYRGPSAGSLSLQACISAGHRGKAGVHPYSARVGGWSWISEMSCGSGWGAHSPVLSLIPIMGSDSC